MADQPATLRDVAERAGVHPATASRALNPGTRDLVSDATAMRVRAAAEELRYHPNPMAKGLRTNRSSMIGVLIPDLNNPLFPPIVRGIEDGLEGAGYSVVLANTEYDPDRERRLFETMQHRLVDGFVIATALRHDPMLESMVDRGTPVVLVNRTVEGGLISSVTIDDELGIRLAVDHLASLGHRRIAHLAGPQDTSTGHGRRLAFLRALSDRGFEPDPDLVVVADLFTEEHGAAALREVLERCADVTAVVAGNDRMAVGCYAALDELGLRCPQDVSVVGYNDLPFMERLCPPLTTIKVPQRELGRRAAELLLEQLEEPASPRREIRLSPELVVRGSTDRADGSVRRPADRA